MSEEPVLVTFRRGDEELVLEFPAETWDPFAVLEAFERRGKIGNIS